MAEVIKTYTGIFFFGCCLMCLIPSHGYAQKIPKQERPTNKSSVSQPPSESPPDSITAGSSNKSDVKDAVEFQSSDSLVVSFENGRKAELYGSAKVAHTTGTLTAGKIEMDLETSTVEAKSETPEDTLSLPFLTRQSDEIRSNRILFNYKTQRGKFEAARVEVGEGHLIGSKVKNVNASEVFIEDGIYSTCPPDYLYYYIKAKKMKVVDQDEVFFSNARLFILDIPYPLVFPFGYFPSKIEKKQSGLLTPTYVFNGQSTRGLGLSNFGWFQYVNDYLTAQIAFDLYTSGTYYTTSQVQYKKRDFYSGSLSLGYSREQGLEKTDPGFSKTINKSLAVQHNQTISPYASLTANVNLRTADYYIRNSYDINDRANTTSSSRLAYNYNHPENLFTFSTNAQLAQNFSNNTTQLSGPSAKFSLKTLSPFQNSSSTNKSKWYESISFKYNNSFDSKFNYTPIDADTADINFWEAFTKPSKYREATGNNDYIKFGFQQTAGLTIGKLIRSPYVNLSTGINYNEYWYPTSIRKHFNADSNRVETEKVLGFEAARDFSTSISFSTTLYGISNRRIGSLQGFRHTMRPSLSFGFRPDFSDPKWGYYKTVQTDTTGRTSKYSIFEDEIYRGPGAGEQRSLSFSLSNVFETKIVKRDSTGEVNEKNLRLVDNLSLSTSYNFAADSLNLSQLNTSISSSAIKGLSLRANANFSFYALDSLGREYNKFLISEEGRLAQMRNFSLNASTSFKGGSGRRIKTFAPVYRKQYDPFDQAVFRPVDPHFGEELVSPLNSPWSLTLNFSYSWTYRYNANAIKRAVLNATNITFLLTPRWNFSTTLGYDFIQKELTPSQFVLSRNIECWNLSFQINPFGEYQYYFFKLTLNSAQMQSLFQKLPVLKNLERSSSKTGKRSY